MNTGSSRQFGGYYGVVPKGLVGEFHCYHNRLWISGISHLSAGTVILCQQSAHQDPNCKLFQMDWIRAFVFSSMRISSGHGLAKPSVGHLRVASIPIFEPKSCKRAA